MIWTCPRDNKHSKFIKADVVTYKETEVINPRGEYLDYQEPHEMERDDSADCVCMTCGAVAVWANPMPEKVEM